MKKRFVYLDELRMIATVFVIAVHTVSLGTVMVEERSAYWYGFEILNYLFLCCNLLFVMISGALLLSVENESAGTFYKKRFVKVCVPMVVYYILYVCAGEGFVWLLPDHWLMVIKRILLGAPDEAPHLWLIYVILWLYVLTPILRYLVQHIPDQVLSGVMVVILLFQTVCTYVDYFYENRVFYGMMDSFVGVFLLGYFLAKDHTKGFRYTVFAAGMASVGISIVHIMNGSDYHRYIFNNAPLMVCYAAAVFLLVKQLFENRKEESRFTEWISRYSFGIMLIHWGVLHYLVKQILHVNPLTGGAVMGTVLMIVLTLFFSLPGAAVLDKTLIRWTENAIYFMLSVVKRKKN